MSNPEDIAGAIEARAAALEAWIRKQSGAYVQIEDMGQTMTRVRALREAADFVRRGTWDIALP